MKKIILLLIASLIMTVGFSQKRVHVRSYRTKSGKSVRSHYRKAPHRHSFVNYNSFPVLVWRKAEKEENNALA
jgi:hypothetical protein